jgi:hypothetical protein
MCSSSLSLVDGFLSSILSSTPFSSVRQDLIGLLFRITQSIIDNLVSFLKSASWKKDKENRNVFFYDNNSLEPSLVKASSGFPDYLQRHGFQVWKVLEETKFVEKDRIRKQGYIIPVTIISGHPRLLSEPSQPLLIPNTLTVFQREPIISPALYLILALPPNST